MSQYIRIIDLGQIVATKQVGPFFSDEEDAYHDIYLEELIAMSRQNKTRRRLGGFFQRFLERATDPDREHPLMDLIKERVIPLAIAYFSSQLPYWLNQLEADDDEPPKP